MRILQITPGTGGMICGACFRDNALVKALRESGHDAELLPLYLPFRLEDSNANPDATIQFGGLNVYLDQVWAPFRKAPEWLRRPLSHPRLLKLLAGRAAKTSPQDVGPMTVSMLRGEDGAQRRDLEEMVAFLKTRDRFDAIFLSNGMLIGMGEPLKRHLGCPVFCNLQGEDDYMDKLPDPYREQAWEALRMGAEQVDGLTAPSEYYAQTMAERLGLSADHVAVVWNGIDVSSFSSEPRSDRELTLGYFARMCPEKGLEELVDAYLLLRERAVGPTPKLLIGGYMGPSDRRFVQAQQRKLRRAGVLHDVEFHPNVTKEEKARLLSRMTLFTTPAVYSEAFGLYVLEAMASGAPVALPRRSAFPEIVEATQGGWIYDPVGPLALAQCWEGLLSQPDLLREAGARARAMVAEKFSHLAMAASVASVANLQRR